MIGIAHAEALRVISSKGSLSSIPPAGNLLFGCCRREFVVTFVDVAASSLFFCQTGWARWRPARSLQYLGKTCATVPLLWASIVFW